MSDNATERSALYAEHRKFLQGMAATYELKDEQKARLVLVTYAMQEGDLDQIFKYVRCRHCG